MVFLKCIRNEILDEKITELEVNKWYVMDNIEIGQSSSTVTINGKRYNSILFDYYDEYMNKFDIYRSEYSPYFRI